MFDKLVESNSAGAEFKPRRKFFMVSSVVVGIMFLSAVVFSLYAQDIDLGTDDFELSVLLAPLTPDIPEPEVPRQQPQQRDEQSTSELPSRQDLIARIDQQQPIPTSISTTRMTQATIPESGRFTHDPGRADSNGSGVSGPPGTGEPGTGSADTEVATVELPKATEPPPIPKSAPKKPITKTKGVVNGDAISLPKPPYPAIARAAGVTGTVSVQVLIDETGRVVSAKAVDGHAFFKVEAERAARNAKFNPTLLSDQPVKVSGVIVYRFSK